jgi:aerobic carbon-monoxide dehydrogenase medium subunit
MKPAPFIYHDPRTVADVAALLAEHDNARVLAGGQSLMPMMNFRYVQPEHLIDINRVEDLAGIRPSTGHTSFGAMTRQSTLLQSDELHASFPIIREALSHVGHRQTRARGTIGGSLCHFDPSAELCNMAALHDGEFTLTSKSGERRVPFAEFGIGYLTTAVQPGEFLSEVSFKRWPESHGYGFAEFALRHGDFAICEASCLMTVAQNGPIDRIAIVLSGVSPIPMRLTDQEQAALGRNPDHELFRSIAAAASQVEAMSDAYVSADYRKHLARIMSYRAVAAAAKRAQERHQP